MLFCAWQNRATYTLHIAEPQDRRDSVLSNELTKKGTNKKDERAELDTFRTRFKRIQCCPGVSPKTREDHGPKVRSPGT